MGVAHYLQSIERARQFATAAHAGQVRKYSGEPYITHPEKVAQLVQSVPHVTEMVQAALLHDTVEDTEATIQEIRAEFGNLVASYVLGLTNVAAPGEGDRGLRFLINSMHLGKQCREVQTIKVADIIHNTEFIVDQDPEFAKTYLSEKRRVLLLLTKADSTLLASAWGIVNVGLIQLEQTA